MIQVNAAEPASATIATRHEEILCDSYARIAATRSNSYGSTSFYAVEEKVMTGLLLVFVFTVLMGAFVAYEWLRGRV